MLGLIRDQGVPKRAAIQLLGSFKQESGLNPCQKQGDSGVAWGLNSWHPNRRQDMPERLDKQVAWAIKTEMPRDCASCHTVIMDPDSSTSEVRQAIQDWTRWGHEGPRWSFADNFGIIF